MDAEFVVDINHIVSSCFDSCYDVVMSGTYWMTEYHTTILFLFILLCGDFNIFAIVVGLMRKH